MCPLNSTNFRVVQISAKAPECGGGGGIAFRLEGQSDKLRFEVYYKLVLNFNRLYHGGINGAAQSPPP